MGRELSSVLLRLVSSDWGERYAAVAELEELVQHNPAAVSTAVVKVCVYVWNPFDCLLHLNVYTHLADL